MTPTDTLREAVARAIAVRDGSDGLNWTAYASDADAALSAIEAAGWLVVPVTDEMVERAALALAKRNHVPQWREFIPDARAALLAAMGSTKP